MAGPTPPMGHVKGRVTSITPTEVTFALPLDCTTIFKVGQEHVILASPDSVLSDSGVGERKGD